MSLKWFAEIIIESIISWTIFGALAWLWAKRKLLPLLRKHAPALAAMLAEREPEVDDVEFRG